MNQQDRNNFDYFQVINHCLKTNNRPWLRPEMKREVMRYMTLEYLIAAVPLSYRNTFCLLNPRTGEIKKTFTGHSGWVYAVAISPDGSRVVSVSDDKTMRVWNIATGVCEKILEGHSHGVTAVAISHDGSRAVSGLIDNTVQVWNIATGVCEKTFMLNGLSIKTIKEV